MANRLKEDEKNERIIRGLLKLPENRRCINCNSLGPQYVCTNFWTFVCTTCSGIHREFTHRVKSVSMAKFTSQEVTSLQEGGNQRAREIYFKEWDPQRQSAPDSSNVDRLRDFIKHLYVDGRYTGERNYGRPPSGKMGDREDQYDNRRNDAYQKGSRSPPYEETYERRYNERSSPGGRSDDKYSRYSYDERRSPGYDQESRQYNDYRRSPARPEVVNDWRREDRFGNRLSDGDSKHEARSPERPKEPEASSPPVVRPVREILGDNVIPLRISEPPKGNVGRTADAPAQTQRTASSSSLGSVSGNTVEVKVENTKSLIDFDADPEPPAAGAVPQTQQTATTQSIAQPASAANDNNWASFDFAPETKAPQAPSNANSLESVLSQLSVPSGPSHPSGMPGVAGVTVAPAGAASSLPFNSGAPAAAQVSNLSTLPASGLSPTMPVNGGNSFVNTEPGQWHGMQQQQPPLFPASTGISTAQHFTPQYTGASGNQNWNLSAAPTVQATVTTSAGAPQVTSSEATSSGVSPPSAVEVKPSGRQALPEDLFTATYSHYPAPVPGWQTGPPRGMGFLHYNHVAAPVPTFPQPSKSANPFDLNEPVQAQPFPSLSSLQSALPNMPPTAGLHRTASLGSPSPAWIPSQSSPYPSALPSQTPPYAAGMPPRAYMAQQVPGSIPLSGNQAIGGFGSEGATFGAINMDQQVGGRYSAPPTPQPFSSVGGNPFG
ncbi:hypothetical protein Tsubulata_033378 [Turnera subulata]|uniref:Arf-GAP domain-containing protein n=1 Tax=Turnera subulata TaxID=218843 RepID=A0A9Q0GFD9_9ROSI|nr:hypothetical protein Tsubulata_033378 [Turnera subulata]